MVRKHRAGIATWDYRPRRPRSRFRLLVTLGWLLVIGTTFGLGYWLARYDAVNALAGADLLRAEIGLLSEEVARGREERLRLERAHQMDREAKRRAQESLAELQQERLDLIKQVVYLQRLIREGQDGIVVVKELQLRKGSAPRSFRFEMALSQLVPQQERTRGRVSLSVVLSRDGKEEELPLDALPGSSPAARVMDFEHFETIAGEIVVPEGAEPERLIIDIEPDGDSLASSAEVFLWPREACSLSPIVEPTALAETGKVE